MNSLTRRLALLTTLWVSLGLGLIGWFVIATDERQIESTADARLSSLLDALVASAALCRRKLARALGQRWRGLGERCLGFGRGFGCRRFHVFRLLLRKVRRAAASNRVFGG